MNIAGFLNVLPDELKSRKVLIIALTMLCLLLLAVVGTIITTLMGADNSLFQTALQYIGIGGPAGAAAQAIPDAMQARNGTYRPNEALKATLVELPTAPGNTSFSVVETPQVGYSFPQPPPSIFGRR